MDDYQKEQFEGLTAVRGFLMSLSPLQLDGLKQQLKDYIYFRTVVDDFLSQFFKDVCTRRCFVTRESACCSKDGIMAFWGDMTVNAVLSNEKEVESLLTALKKSNTGRNCVYLAETGCLWKVKPIICQMFLCSNAKNEVFKEFPYAETQWFELKKQERKFIWPDRQVLFDDLEDMAVRTGICSPLMYMHTSPGLLRVKELARSGKPGSAG
jgi:hypothetical protein